MTERVRAMRKYLRSLILLPGICVFGFGAQVCVADATTEPATGARNYFVTNAAQFRTLSPSEYLDGCDFHLEGLITLVDTNRNLIVLQDETGAVSLNFRSSKSELRFGQQVSLDGTNCVPSFVRFPDFPFNRSGSQLRSIVPGAEWAAVILSVRK